MIKENWSAILGHIKTEYELTDISFNTWLKPLSVFQVDEEEAVVRITVPSDQMGITYIKKKYLLPLQVAVSEMAGKDYRIELVSAEDVKKAEGEARKASEQQEDRIRERYAGLNSDNTFDTFVVGNNNKFAHAAALNVAERPGESYNPLYLYGEAGLGKTHLMQAIGDFVIRHHPDMKVVYVSSDVFTNELITAIRSGRDDNTLMERFREKYRGADVFLIDDIQFIIGKEATQQEFFHTFNILFDAHKQIVLSSDRPPKDLQTLDERYRSRCAMGLQADIGAPDYEMRMAILQRKNQADGGRMNEEILDYIASNMTKNIRTLLGAYNRVNALAKLTQTDVSLEAARDILQDMLTTSERKEITVAYIIDVVSEHFGVRREDIISTKRSQNIVYPRQIVMYFAREMTNLSMKAIGEQIGGRDHSTVIHSIEKVEDEVKRSQAEANTIETIRRKICSP